MTKQNTWEEEFNKEFAVKTHKKGMWSGLEYFELPKSGKQKVFPAALKLFISRTIEQAKAEAYERGQKDMKDWEWLEADRLSVHEQGVEQGRREAEQSTAKEILDWLVGVASNYALETATTKQSQLEAGLARIQIATIQKLIDELKSKLNNPKEL